MTTNGTTRADLVLPHWWYAAECVYEDAAWLTSTPARAARTLGVKVTRVRYDSRTVIYTFGDVGTIEVVNDGKTNMGTCGWVKMWYGRHQFNIVIHALARPLAPMLRAELEMACREMGLLYLTGMANEPLRRFRGKGWCAPEGRLVDGYLVR